MFRECKPCNKIICPEISRCDYKYTGDCGCCTYCARSESGRCGGALNMWGSCGPGLKCVYRIGSVFNEERFGFCETEICAMKTCGYRQRCRDRSKKGSGLICTCPSYRCKDKYNPVCGYDEITYNSVCKLQKKECETGRLIGIKSLGECSTLMSVPVNISGVPNGWSLPLTPTPPKQCVHDGKVYRINDVVEFNDPCFNVTCSEIGKVLVVPIPGCGSNVPEIDYKVEYKPVHGKWSDWSKWGSCDCETLTKTRSRTCVLKYEGKPCPKNESQVEMKTCSKSEC